MFAEAVLHAARAHAAAEYPRESCGLVIAGEYLPCENLAEDPLNGFRIQDELMLDAGDQLQAIVHSHPDGPAHPSFRDMEGQLRWAVPWGIICSYEGGGTDAPFWWGDQVPRPPLMQRGFRWGVTDCYSLIRDWYLQHKGLQLPDFARDWGEWQGPKPRVGYMEHHKAGGFIDLGPITGSILAGMRPGDLMIMQIRSKVPNHAGIIDVDGHLLQHQAWDDPVELHRTPLSVPAGRYFGVTTNIFRHRSAA